MCGTTEVVPSPVVLLPVAPMRIFSSGHHQVPTSKRLGSGDRNFRRSHNAGQRRQVRKRISLLAPTNPQNRSPNQEQRRIRTNFGGHPQLLRDGQLLFQSPLQCKERRHGIGRSASESALHWQMFFNLDNYPPVDFERVYGPLHNSIAGVRFVRGDARVITADFDSRAANNLHADDIMQRDGLIDGTEFVEPVSASRPDAQSEIDLRKGSDSDRHGEMIVTRKRLMGTKVLRSLRYGIEDKVLTALRNGALQPATRDGAATARSTLSTSIFQ